MLVFWGSPKTPTAPPPSGSVCGDGLLSRAPSLVCARGSAGGRCGNCCDCARAMAGSGPTVGRRELVMTWKWMKNDMRNGWKSMKDVGKMPRFQVISSFWMFLNINEFESNLIEHICCMLFQTLHCLGKNDFFILAEVSSEVVVNQITCKLLPRWFSAALLLTPRRHDTKRNWQRMKSRGKGIWRLWWFKASIAESNPGWWLTYPSEKWWSSPVGIIIPNIWKNNPDVPNHQPVISCNIKARRKPRPFLQHVSTGLTWWNFQDCQTQ